MRCGGVHGSEKMLGEIIGKSIGNHGISWEYRGDVMTGIKIVYVLSNTIARGSDDFLMNLVVDHVVNPIMNFQFLSVHATHVKREGVIVY